MKRPPARTGSARVVAIEAKRPPAIPPVVIGGGPAPMTARLAEIIRGMVERQRDRERGSAS